MRPLTVWAAEFLVAAINIARAADPPAKPAPLLRQYCFQCHGNGQSMGGISLEQLAAQASVGESFQKWNKVAAVLEEHRMPPKGMPRPSDEQVQQSLAWIHSELAAYAKAHDGDPGRVTVRRLTSGEYGYAIED